MKLIEKILLVLLIIGLFLKFNLIVGGTTLVLFTMLVMVILYGYFAFLIFNNIKFLSVFKKASYKGISGIRLAYTIIAGFCFQMLLLGIIFKLMYWPGADVTLLGGLATTLIALILTLIYFFKHKERFHKLMIIRLVPFLIFGLILIFVPSNKIFEFQYRGHDAYIKAFYEYEEDYNNEEKYNRKQLEYDRATLSHEDFKLAHPEEK